ncbi:Epimerase family protein [Limihaloglobus sulfuriphilus]|uniref:Epimerase family protein n=1 Tax=Limihaloglobus sulfuriphilus TaxID=1851148 RepID=A0A1Q2MF56_9BACT|nr:TIGR01777 family oxidoreductase [Limihaloglobus sulfuriphilus]AQQ71289.1 Epimerase family protein [Limihaloglobus sulfuriphilus]
MKIAVAGATGFVGSELCRLLSSMHELTILTRDTQKGHLFFGQAFTIVEFSENRPDLLISELEGVDAVINLAGENIAVARWTPEIKQSILNSRLESSRRLLKTFKEMPEPPKTYIISSATGYYGNRPGETLNESSPSGSGFLADVCRQNEALAPEFESLSIRTIIIRSGPVMDRGGGALKKMMLPFRFYLGACLGSGEQHMPWISLEDETAAIKFLLEHGSLSGVFNLTSPNPATNRQISKAIAAYLNRPCFFRLPAAALRLLMGEMAGELLSSQQVLPERLLEAGFEFKRPLFQDVLST